jgi:hypothetical protein
MTTPGISAATFSAGSQQAMQSLSAHKHGGRHPHSLTDIDSTGSSAATAPSVTGKTGSKIDITA